MNIPASLPSPSSGTLQLGPLALNAYGLLIALGVVAAVKLASSRLEKAGTGTRDDMSSIAVFGVIGGVIGARLYHVATDWSTFADDLGRIPQIWRGAGSGSLAALRAASLQACGVHSVGESRPRRF